MADKRQLELTQISENNIKKQKVDNDEDQLASDSDGLMSDNDGDEQTVDQEWLNRVKYLMKYGRKDIIGLEERFRHKVEDVEFKTIPIYRFNEAKEIQTELIKKLESALFKARQGLVELEEKERDVKFYHEGFMFFSESSNFSLNPKQKERFKSVILQSSCTFLPSPDAFRSGNEEGVDDTGTLEDFQEVYEWARCHKISEDENCYVIDSKGVDEQGYNDLIKFAFDTGYEGLRSEMYPTQKELLFYYYAGHGLDPKNLDKKTCSAAPALEKHHVLQRSCFKDASPYIGKNRRVKGGELCLHKFGFCDFEGLVEPFIAAIKSKSSDEKKNKHLIIVLDSCHSGQIAEDLTKFSEKQGRGWLNEGCSVTVQASCGKDEKAVGGYFTPTFLFLNDSENESVLKKLLEDWDKMTDKEKNKWRNQLPFSSPMVSSTRNVPKNSPIQQEWLLIEDQNFHLTLFRDHGFFKYCHCEIFGPLVGTPKLGMSRVLTPITASTFLENEQFTVIDFKLKTYKGRKFGLFLLEDPTPDRAICAHVHFREGASKVGRINLVHHMYTPNSLPQLDYEREDCIGLFDWEVKKNMHKITVAMVPNRENANPSNLNHWVAWKWENLDQSFLDLAKAELSSGFRVNEDMQREVALAMKLVTECHRFVVRQDEKLWSGQWRQQFEDRSHRQLFREKQRSLSMENYLKRIKDYDLPEVQ